MRRHGFTIISALIVAAVLAGSCDFLRTVAGRPTSREIAQAVAQRDSEEFRQHQARVDSVKRIEQEYADSIASGETQLMDSLLRINAAIYMSEHVTEEGREGLARRCYIIVGVFRDPSNVQNKMQRCKAEGLQAFRIPLKSGLTAVAVSPTNTVLEAMETMNELRQKRICPQDSWILVND